jgi:hypothetical protein
MFRVVQSWYLLQIAETLARSSEFSALSKYVCKYLNMCWIKYSFTQLTCRHIPSKFNMSDLNLQEIHEFAIELAKKAGNVILEASNSRLSNTSSSVGEKKNCPRLPGSC